MKDRESVPEQNLGEGIKSMSRQELCALVSELCACIRREAGADRYRGGVYPENIRLSADGSASIGPGKTGDWEGQELQFIAPELYWGGELGPTADVYALGMLLYYGATGGRLPFDGDAAARMDGKSISVPKSVGRQLYPIISKATAFKAADRYQSVGELQAMVDSCLQNRYIGGEGSSQTLFRKDQKELSDVEQMMVSIIAEENAGMESAPAVGEESAEETSDEEKEYPVVEEKPAEAAPAEPEVDEEMERIRALFNAPLEEPPFESDAVAQLPEENGEETLTPVPLAMSGEGEDVRVYQPTPHSGRKEGANPGKQPVPILTVDENPELAPVVPLTEVTGGPVTRQEQIAQEVRQRRRRPVAAVLILCALLILSAIVANSMLQGGISLRGSKPGDAGDDASGMVSVPTAPLTDSDNPDGQDTPFDYGTLATETDTKGAAAKEHRYEVIASDMSWTEARDACREKGGYLVVISDEEEFDKIVQLVIDSGLSRVWVGCHRIDDTLVWENTDEVLYYPWDYNEPSYYDGYDGTIEDYLLLWHNNRWVYNDSRDDPVADYPELYSGSLGYVIEYDE